MNIHMQRFLFLLPLGALFLFFSLQGAPVYVFFGLSEGCFSFFHSPSALMIHQCVCELYFGGQDAYGLQQRRGSVVSSIDAPVPVQ